MTTLIERRDDGNRSARWWPLRWANPLGGDQPQLISLFDLAELRGAVDTNRVAAGLEPVRWVGRTDADPSFVAGATPIRAVHFTQLRDAIGELWEAGELGPLPEFSAGPLVAQTRHVSRRDPLDLRRWVEDYEEARPDLAARVVWRFSGEPDLWPPLVIDGPAPDAAMWDGVGQSLFWSDPDTGVVTELRRIDTHWYRHDLQTGDAPAVTIAAALGDGPDSPLPLTIARPAVGDLAGLPFVTWDPVLPAIQSNWTVERDALDRVIRIVSGDGPALRLAYDGLGRLRKRVDRATWHVLGPDLAVPIRGGAT